MVSEQDGLAITERPAPPPRLLRRVNQLRRLVEDPRTVWTGTASWLISSTVAVVAASAVAYGGWGVDDGADVPSHLVDLGVEDRFEVAAPLAGHLPTSKSIVRTSRLSPPPADAVALDGTSLAARALTWPRL